MRYAYMKGGSRRDVRRSLNASDYHLVTLFRNYIEIPPILCTFVLIQTTSSGPESSPNETCKKYTHPIIWKLINNWTSREVSFLHRRRAGLGTSKIHFQFTKYLNDSLT